MRKIGDKIKIKSFEEILKITKERLPGNSSLLWLKTENVQAGCYTPFNIEGMAKFCNKSVKITGIGERRGYKTYTIEDDRSWIFVEWMIKDSRTRLELE